MKVSFKFDEEANVGQNVGVSVGTNADVKNMKLNKTQKKVLFEISKNNQITQKEMALLLNITDRTVQRNTKILQEKGLLRLIGSDKSGHWEVIQ